jgi:pyrophosphate--fructose-6-phosphate 1-phosphotransferase
MSFLRALLTTSTMAGELTAKAQLLASRISCTSRLNSVLVPEGLIEFIPEVGLLIKELNDIMATGVESSNTSAILAALTPASASVFEFLPTAVRQQLLLDRDSHGNVQVSKIETENLLIQVHHVCVINARPQVP